MLSIDAKVEPKNNNGHLNFSEAIFFSINHYGNKKQIRMLFSAHDLRALVYALRELHQTGQSKFKNYTSSQNRRNEMTLGYSGERYFINIERQLPNKEAEFKVEHIFGRYSLLAFCDTASLICDEIEKAVFAYQLRNEPTEVANEN
jgi:hypothetical protein